MATTRAVSSAQAGMFLDQAPAASDTFLIRQSSSLLLDVHCISSELISCWVRGKQSKRYHTPPTHAGTHKCMLKMNPAKRFQRQNHRPAIEE